MKQLLIKILLLFFVLPSLALAHTGVGEASGFLHGLSHPMSGIDHLLAMLAVGLWAAQIGGYALWAVPCTFVGVMVMGGIFGFFSIPVPFIEEGILVSVLVLGVLIAGAFRFSLHYSALIISLFAIFHGYAHGAEIPPTINAVLYTVGFVLATAMLHVTGIGFGIFMQKTNLHKATRFTGGVIALTGIYLAIS
ncbi:HupE/UreJ family protein [Zooshikella sp. RANM57]|uniref:HupE/UreJ family protein n=1 Tax=Zooshikella sp. RANM57 TaxID=3425863 RepID=UPI003D6FE6DF